MDVIRSSVPHQLIERPRLPWEVTALLPREREIATLVFKLGAVTARQVEDALSVRLSNAAVRSMLNRLVAKGILKRVLSYNAFVYLPALTATHSGSLALERFAKDYFAGSIERAAATMNALLESHR
jgi:predicted transcriptional regulator